MGKKASSTVTKKSPARTSKTPRQLKAPRYKRLRYSKRIKHPAGKLPSAFRLFVRSLVVLKRNWKLFGMIVLVYCILTIVLVQTISGGMGLGAIKSSLEELFKGAGAAGKLSTGLALFGVLLGSAGGNGNQIASVYQSFITLTISLALIWSLRQVHSDSGSRPSVKQAFYKSMHPLVPFLVVLTIAGFQLLPLFMGATIYGIVTSNNLAVTAAEKLAWGGVFFTLAVLSLYWLTSTLLALYVVTLPDMLPMQAVRSVRELVRYRRWTVLRKILFLPVALLVLLALVAIPLVLFLTPAAEWLFLGLTGLSLAIIHSYMYTLYRELL